MQKQILLIDFFVYILCELKIITTFVENFNKHLM